MNKITPTVILALILGGLVGYIVHGGVSPTPKSESPQSAMPDRQISQTANQPDSKEWKMQNAMSAAPDAIAKEATVLDWPEKEGSEMAILKKGTNEWTCLPDYPGSPGNDPICGDKSTMQWFTAYMSHKEPKLAQVGIGYMLQGGSDASNTDPFATKPAVGEDWVTAPAHVMMFPVGKLDSKNYGTDYKSGKSWIMYPGTPYEHLMIPVK